MRDMSELLAAVGTEGARRFRTQGRRRGHSLDMDKGCNLKQLLEAAEWRQVLALVLGGGLLGLVARSSAFTSYLEKDDLENGAVQECHVRPGSSMHAEASVCPLASDSESSGDTDDCLGL